MPGVNSKEQALTKLNQEMNSPEGKSFQPLFKWITEQSAM